MRKIWQKSVCFSKIIKLYEFSKKKKKNIKAFAKSQFGYFPLTCMFHGRKADLKIDHIVICVLYTRIMSCHLKSY